MAGYPPPQGEYPPQQGYPPPQQGYPPPQQGYPPPQQGYPPPQYQPAQQQQSSNVVVVQAGQPQVVTHTVIQRDDRPNHLLHAIITFFFWPWIFVWLLLCLIYGC